MIRMAMMVFRGFLVVMVMEYVCDGCCKSL